MEDLSRSVVTSLAVLIALLITGLVVAVMLLRPGGAARSGSSLVSRVLGLILIAMGLQFMLTNLLAFFPFAG